MRRNWKKRAEELQDELEETRHLLKAQREAKEDAKIDAEAWRRIAMTAQVELNKLEFYRIRDGIRRSHEDEGAVAARLRA